MQAKFFFALVLFHITCKASTARLCLKEPHCYCNTKKTRTDIFCKYVADLSPIDHLLSKYSRIYSLTLQAPGLSSIPSRIFDGHYVDVLEFDGPLSNIPDDALSGIINLQDVHFGGTHFTSVPVALTNPSFRLVQMDHGLLSGIEKQFQNNSVMTSFLFSNNRIGVISEEAFRNSENIQYLNLSSNQLDYLHLEIFDDLKKLRSIDLSYNHLHSVDGYFDSLNPQAILLYGNNLSRIDGAFPYGMWNMKLLDLGGNPYLVINASTFVGSMQALTTLRLNDNNFKEFDYNMLKNFPKLYKLCLNGNDLVNLSLDFFSHTPHLHTIELDDNNLSSIEALFPLTNQKPSIGIHTLKTVALGGNMLASIEFGATSESVVRLDLSRNEINFLHVKDIQNLTSAEYLNISRNGLTELETGSFAKQQKLRELDLSSNQLSVVDQDELIGLNDLKMMSLRNNELASVQGAFQTLHSLTTLDLSSNNLTSLTLGSFSNKQRGNLRKLWMADNPWICDCRIAWILDWLNEKGFHLEDEPLCQSPPQLHGVPIRSLNRSDLLLWPENCPEACECNCIPDGENVYAYINCTGRGLKSVPEVFPSISKVISLANNDITSFDGFGSSQFPYLQLLDLENNTLMKEPLVIPTSTKVLKLAGNKLSTFNMSLINESNRLITLSRNPWLCDCKVWEFREWLISYNNSVPDFKEVRCGDKGHLESRVVIHLNRNDVCQALEDNRRIVITAIAVSVGVIFVCLCLFFRKALAALLYSCGCSCLKADEKHQYPFDAFLLNADEDEDFALGVIAEGLENSSPGCHLFIPTRHVFLTTSPVNIDSSLNDCCKVIVILSRNFLRNGQCVQLLKRSMSCSIQNSSKRTIFITKEGRLPEAEVDTIVGTVMKNSVCLQWGQCLFWERLRYFMPKSIDRRSSNNEVESQSCIR